MCFSAQASFIAAGTLAIIGAAVTRKVCTRQQWLLALMPLFFALQQMFEGVIWVTLNNGNTVSLLHKSAVYGFIFFAVVVWPSYFPVMLYVFEQSRQRKLLLFANMLVGACLSLILMVICSYYGITVFLADHHLAYNTAISINISPSVYALYSLFYVWVTVGSMLISSVPCMWVMGVVGGISYAVAYLLYYASFGSVWCFFAAIISSMIYFVLGRWNEVNNR